MSKISETELETMFDELLNELGEVAVAGYKFDPARVLKELDPIAYREGLADYADSLSRDGHRVEGYE